MINKTITIHVLVLFGERQKIVVVECQDISPILTADEQNRMLHSSIVFTTNEQISKPSDISEVVDFTMENLPATTEELAGKILQHYEGNMEEVCVVVLGNTNIPRLMKLLCDKIPNSTYGTTTITGGIGEEASYKVDSGC